MSIACQNPGVAEGGKLPLAGEAAQRLLLPHLAVAVEVAPDLGESTKNPPLSHAPSPRGFSWKLRTCVAVELDGAEAAGGLHGGDRRERALLAVVGDQCGDVDVGEAVAIGEAEVLVTDVGERPLQTPARHRLFAGVHERHPPRLGAGAVDLDVAAPQVEGEVLARMQVIVGEELLDDIALVAEADHELLDAVGRVDLHDVPEHRLAADLDHRLGANRGLLAEPRAQTTGQDHRLHPMRSGAGTSAP